MTFKSTFTIAVLSIFAILLGYISGIFSLFTASVSLCIYMLLCYPFYYIYKKIKNRSYTAFSQENLTHYVKIFLYRASWMILTLFVLIGGFTYYQNDINPAKLPIYTLTNGDKTVKFQTMSHIATQNFYDSVQENITQAKLDGYVYFFEGVRPGSLENSQAFDEAMGVEFNENTYDNLSKLYGLTFQDNRMFLGLVNNLDFNVDISVDEIMKHYKQKIDGNPPSESSLPEIPLSTEEIVEELLNHLTTKELVIFQYINRSIINLMVKNTVIQDSLQNNFANGPLFEVILDTRNEHIAQEILESEFDKIFMTYGMLHFQGILDILKSHDPKWYISKIEYVYPLK